jgi:CRP-like cAMP-binding protein
MSMNPAIKHAPDPRRNGLLAALSESEAARWQPHLESLELAQGQVLCASGIEPEYAYFPTTAIVSLVSTTFEGESTETAVVGHEGVVGISLFMGGNRTPSEAVVQSAGHAYRVRAQVLRGAASSATSSLTILLRYALGVIAQVAQTAACNRFHSVDQLYCRRLLIGLDRQPADAMAMTQENAAGLLGVRREGVTAAAHKLQREGVIRYRRGRIDVLDRQALESRTCEFLTFDAGHPPNGVDLAKPHLTPA